MRFEIYVFTYKEPKEMVERCVESINWSLLDYAGNLGRKVHIISTNIPETNKYLLSRFRNVSILHSPQKGKWRAVNAMIRNMNPRTDFVICVDADSTIDQKAIRIINRAMLRKDVGIVASVPRITCTTFQENVFRVFQEIAIYRSIKKQEERGYCGTMIESIWALKKKVLKPMPVDWVNEGDWFSRTCREAGMVHVINKNLFYDTKPVGSFNEMINVKRRIVGGGKKHGGMSIEGEWSHWTRLKETLQFMFITDIRDVPYIIVAMFLEAAIYISLMTSPPKKEWYTAPSARR